MNRIIFIILVTTFTCLLINSQDEKNNLNLPTQPQYKEILNPIVTTDNDTVKLQFNGLKNISVDTKCFIINTKSDIVKKYYGESSSTAKSATEPTPGLISGSTLVTIKKDEFIKNFGIGTFYIIVSYNINSKSGKVLQKDVIRTSDFTVSE